MNEQDDFDLHGRLAHVFGDEPPMQSDAAADLQRGRRRSRRRRVGAVAVTAAAVPALMISGWAISGPAANNGGSPRSVEVQPADDSTATPTTDDSDEQCVVVEASPDEGDAGDNQGSIGGPAVDSMTCGSAVTCESLAPADAAEQGVPYTVSSELGKDATERKLNRESAEGSDGDETDPGPGVPDGTIIWHCTETEDPGSLDSGSVATSDEATGRLNDALNAYADPNGTHGGVSSASGSTSMSNLGTVTGVGVGTGWADGEREGYVGLSVASHLGDPTVDCLDPNVNGGPQVECDERTLEDGTVVRVGHGSKNGAERVTVRYDRPNGDIVWATADEATEQWWEKGNGPGPLTSSPVTVSQLVAMVTDDSVHL